MEVDLVEATVVNAHMCITADELRLLEKVLGEKSGLHYKKLFGEDWKKWNKIGDAMYKQITDILSVEPIDEEQK